MLYDRVVTVETLQKNASNADKEGYAPFYGFRNADGVATNAVRINIQPASKTLLALSEGVLGKAFTGFTTSSGIVETMRLTVSGSGDQYIVRGREPYDYGMLKHYELLLSKNTI